VQLPRVLVRLIDPVSGQLAARRPGGRAVHRGGAAHAPAGSQQASRLEIAQAGTRVGAHRQRHAEGIADLLRDHGGELEALADRLAATRAAAASIDGIVLSASIRRFWHGDDLLTIGAHSEHGRSSGHSRLRRTESTNRQVLLHRLADHIWQLRGR
jgi:hypothetical protein